MGLCAIILPILAIFTFGCSNPLKTNQNGLNEANNDTEEVSSTENDLFEDNTAYELGHIEIETTGPDHYFRTVPMYYQKDYTEDYVGYKPIAEGGNLVTCMAMLDSYYSSSYVNPPAFVEKYSEYIDENSGVTDPVALMEAVAENNQRLLCEEPLNIRELGAYISIYGQVVLLKIPHPSIYSPTSTYIIITGLTDDGNFYVRDPVYGNVEKYGEQCENGEVIYDSFELLFEAGSGAVMYTIGGGEPLTDYEEIYKTNGEPIFTPRDEESYEGFGSDTDGAVAP